MPLAASSDSKITIDSPVLSFRVQYPATNPGACDIRGTSCSRQRAFGGLGIVDGDLDDDCVQASLPSGAGWQATVFEGQLSREKLRVLPIDRG